MAVSSLGAQVNMKLTYDGVTHNYSAEEVKITYNGVALTDFDMPPVILESRTLVPIRAVSEAMDAEVNWNDNTKEVYIIKDNSVVVMQIGNNVGTKNGESFTFDVPPRIINDRTMIPVRFISEMIGMGVTREEKTSRIEIIPY